MSRDRTVVITEASSPVALATATVLAADGHAVVMGCRRSDICEELAARLRTGGASVFAAHLDLAEPLSIDGFVDAVEYLVGPPDVLISTVGVAERCWVGAQHLVTQLVSPMLDAGCGDVVLLGPELVGAAATEADRLLDAWIRGLDAEFVATGVRASIVRSVGVVAPDDAGRLVAGLVCSPDTRLSIVDVIAPAAASSASARAPKSG